MTCLICGQLAENVVDYEVHKRMGHQPWYVQLAAMIVGAVVLTSLLMLAVQTAPKITRKLS